ncbi:hypothetical protein EV356DRAFT_531034 [Viridothelium virens]|uniref:Maintenance of telomere capping protein 1 n=1 Tax=Viridothelium virens TaxID=1048519 RepID=A0A6A6HF01_VIRVR|nr:hypothetical protein EV356DRAFT_531034 [Viridothelium virens]
MSTKKGLTDEELLAQFDTISGDDAAPPTSDSNKPSSKPSAPSTTSKDTDDDDLLADLSALAAQRPTSRPATPRRKDVVNTPSSSTGSGRTSEDKAQITGTGSGSNALPRKSGESGTGFQQKFTPTVEDTDDGVKTQEQEAGGGGGGWWGGLFGAASAAMKTGEAFVKDLSKNEEAQKWAERVQGNAMSLRGLGNDLRTRALPTFTSLLHTLAPPISAHERLQIHLTHDLIAYPSLDPLLYATFSRVMAQVEGGDLLVLQRGTESTHRRPSETGYGSHSGGFGGGSAGGWSDGPWWKQQPQQGEVRRSLGAVRGLVEGTKLCRVQAETYAQEFFSGKGGVEEAARQATAVLSESNPVRSSDIFLALQPIVHDAPKGLFAAGAKGSSEEREKEKAEGGVQEPVEEEEPLVSFAIYLHDPIHSIAFSTVSQPIPHKWIEWLDAVSPDTEDPDDRPQLPPEIQEIIASGGVDPREWVAEWLEEILSLSFGIVAQRYVARRMGVGEGGIGRGKMREQAIESGAGEAARAL